MRSITESTADHHQSDRRPIYRPAKNRLTALSSAILSLTLGSLAAPAAASGIEKRSTRDESVAVVPVQRSLPQPTGSCKYGISSHPHSAPPENNVGATLAAAAVISGIGIAAVTVAVKSGLYTKAPTDAPTGRVSPLVGGTITAVGAAAATLGLVRASMTSVPAPSESDTDIESDTAAETGADIDPTTPPNGHAAVSTVAHEISPSLTTEPGPETGPEPKSTDELDSNDTEPPLPDPKQAKESEQEESPPSGEIAILPTAGAYISNTWAANTMFQLNLSDRQDSYFLNESNPQQGSAWILYRGSRNHLRDDSGALRTQGDKNTVMMGIDMLMQSTNSHDQFTIGVMGGYGHYAGRTHSTNIDDTASGKVDGYGVGLYGTYQQYADTDRGLYADSWLLWNRFDNRVKGTDHSAQKYDSKGMTASLELGYNIPLAEHHNAKYVLQPHTQLIYQNVRADNFRQADGTHVEFLNGARVQTVVGMRAAAHISTGLTSMVTPHIEANWLHSTRGYSVRLDDASADMSSGRNAGQLKLGVQGDLDRRLSLSVELFHNQGNGGYRETGGNLAAKYRY